MTLFLAGERATCTRTSQIVVMLLFENKGFVMSASDVIVLCKDSDDVLLFFNY